MKSILNSDSDILGKNTGITNFAYRLLPLNVKLALIYPNKKWKIYNDGINP